jgi:hypothetical protein
MNFEFNTNACFRNKNTICNAHHILYMYRSFLYKFKRFKVEFVSYLTMAHSLPVMWSWIPNYSTQYNFNCSLRLHSETCSTVYLLYKFASWTMVHSSPFMWASIINNDTQFTCYVRLHTKHRNTVHLLCEFTFNASLHTRQWYTVHLLCEFTCNVRQHTKQWYRVHL